MEVPGLSVVSSKTQIIPVEEDGGAVFFFIPDSAIFNNYKGRGCWCVVCVVKELGWRARRIEWSGGRG